MPTTTADRGEISSKDRGGREPNRNGRRLSDVMNSTVSRRALLAGIAGLGAIPLAACASAPTAADPVNLVRAKGVSRRVPAASAPTAQTSGGMVTFGHALLRASAQKGENWVASPLSIACAFSMVRAGALGTTAVSLDTFFGFPAEGRDEAFNAITREIVTVDGPPKPARSLSPGTASAPPVVVLGNALFARKELALKDAFLRALATDYGAGVRVVDFGTGHAVADINTWVSQETDGRIPALVSSLDPGTALFIANTVYLRASWFKPFAGPGAPAPFTRADGTTVSALMMHDTASRPYASDPSGWQAVSLPYASGDDANPQSNLAMWLILPPPDGDPAEMLAPDVLTAVASSLRAAAVDVTMPKWDFATMIDLGAVLSAMGLTNVFGTGDFGGIADDMPPVSDAVHKANITVDENGTVAAAATGIGFATSALMPQETFQADRPFAFTIVGGAEHVPLFSGVVHDPTAK